MQAIRKPQKIAQSLLFGLALLPMAYVIAMLVYFCALVVTSEMSLWWMILSIPVIAFLHFAWGSALPDEYYPNSKKFGFYLICTLLANSVLYAVSSDASVGPDVMLALGLVATLGVFAQPEIK